VADALRTKVAAADRVALGRCFSVDSKISLA